MAACLTLEDVARDPLRRELFAQAFPAEQPALALRFELLTLVRRYKALVGRRPALLLLAQEAADTFLSPASPSFVARDEPDGELARLAARVRRTVAAGRAPLDLLSGLEALVTARLARDHFPRFLRSEQYPQLCEALRARRELPLAELLVDARRTQFLERFLRREAPADAGSLRFWVDVQTSFLPLLQVTAFSPALFEQTQRAVRRLYNQYCADNAPLAASRVPAAVRRDTLARIMQLQGEPFSPPRYAGLFRAAQDCVWHWLQADVYPRFRASDHYVRLVVEIEDLEADRQLRRLSEHVGTASASAGAGAAKAGAVVVPIEDSHAAREAATTRVLPQRTRHEFERSLLLLQGSDVHSIAFVAFTDARVTRSDQEKRPDLQQAWAARGELFCSPHAAEVAAESHPTYLEYCWDQPAGVGGFPHSPTGHRASIALPPPQPAFRDFIVPDEQFGMLYALCRTQWRFVESADGEKTEFAWQPHVTILVTRTPAWSRGRQLLLRLDSLTPTEVTSSDINESIGAAFSIGDSDAKSLELNAQYAGFYICDHLSNVDIPLQAAFREISAQTIQAMLSCVLVGKSIILVSEEPSTLMLVGEALRTVIQPLQWQHFFLPFCPLGIATAIAGHDMFKEGGAPFIVGFNAVLSVQKQKDSSAEQRHRLKNSIYHIQRAALQLDLPSQPGTSTPTDAPLPMKYPVEFLQTQAIVVDLDSDDVYIPERMDIPEFPQSLVRVFEGLLSEATRSQSVSDADSFMFSPWKHASPFAPMLESLGVATGADFSMPQSDHGGPSKETLNASLLCEFGARLAVMWFLEAMLGDVVFHFCSFRPNLASATPDEAAPQQQPDEYILFEADSFLDSRMELGCRDFFRQCFQTELFQQFLIAQHEHFCAGSQDEN